MIILLLLLSGTYVGWNIGSNHAANCIGTAVGSGIIKYKFAIWLVAVSVLAGSLFQGHYVMKAVGKGIILGELPLYAIFIAMITAGIVVTSSTWLHMPVSTSQAIVSGLLGTGLASFGLTTQTIDFQKLIIIFLAWLSGPFLSMLGAIFFYLLTKKIVSILQSIVSGRIIQRLLISLVIFSACYASYSLGANNSGNAFGPILNYNPGLLRLCTLLGGFSLALGALTFGKRVTQTISRDIIPLDPVSAFAAQFSTALVVHIFALFALPFSTSQGIVGSLIGIGIIHGIQTVSNKTVLHIALSWVLVPVITGFLSYLATWIVARM